MPNNALNISHLLAVMLAGFAAFLILGCPRAASDKKNGSEIAVSSSGEESKPWAIDVTTRAFLPSGEREPIGYGCYSYFLLTLKPTPESPQYDRAIAFYKAFDSLLPDNEEFLEEAGKSFALERINIAYWPLTSNMPVNLDVETRAKWAVDNYDFTRASIILANAHDKIPSGPLVISCSQPLSHSKQDNVLVFDFTRYRNVSFIVPVRRFIERLKEDPDNWVSWARVKGMADAVKEFFNTAPEEWLYIWKDREKIIPKFDA